MKCLLQIDIYFIFSILENVSKIKIGNKMSYRWDAVMNILKEEKIEWNDLINFSEELNIFLWIFFKNKVYVKLFPKLFIELFFASLLVENFSNSLENLHPNKVSVERICGWWLG